ncbi:MAG: hypothetical protein ABMA13_03670 [Chthoniobacteraceae bacterium]
MKAPATLALAAVFIASGYPASAQPPQRKGDQRIPDTVRVGETAPDFKLKTQDGASEVQLSSFRGRRPVVLVFGSYT